MHGPISIATLRRLLTLIVVGALALTACSDPEPLAGIDLPPAAVPDEVELGGWAVSFSLEFEPGFWQEGSHVYIMALVCEPLGDPLSTQPVFLEANSSQEVFDETIYVRLVGLSHLVLGPKTLNSINPQQKTKAILTSIGASATAAQEAFDTCQGAILIDGADPRPMSPEEPFRP
jgi:hypothetical protein